MMTRKWLNLWVPLRSVWENECNLTEVRNSYTISLKCIVSGSWLILWCLQLVFWLLALDKKNICKYIMHVKTFSLCCVCIVFLYSPLTVWLLFILFGIANDGVTWSVYGTGCTWWSRLFLGDGQQCVKTLLHYLKGIHNIIFVTIGIYWRAL